MEPVEYEIELERTNGPAARTSATLPSLTKGQRLNLPVDGGLVYAEVIELTRLTSNHCMRNAKSCDDFDTLLDVARTFDANSCMPPIQTDQGGDKRVFDTAKSAWDITQRGMNRFGLHGVFFPDDEAAELVENDVDAFVLLAFLRSHNGPSAIFMCTNTTASKIGCGGRKWSHERLATARCRLIDLGYVTQVEKLGESIPRFSNGLPDGSRMVAVGCKHLIRN